MHRRRNLGTALIVLTLVLFAGCGDDDVDDAIASASSRAGDLVDEAGDTVDEAAARGQAEAFRLRLRDVAATDDQRRRVDRIREALDDLPGDPEVDGLTDADGDGSDDDGRFEIVVDEARACVRIEVGDIDVSGGACD